MPRSGRVVLPGYPHHIVQRGHNRQAVFFKQQDYRYYLNTLRDWKHEYGIRLYSYCLMTNHIHLIIEPENTKAMGELMKRLAGRQTRYVNRQGRRSGTLWEGRYKSSPIDADDYLLACCRYVDLNPVRAQMADQPEDYYWSSYRERAGLSTQPALLDSPPEDGYRFPESLLCPDAYRNFVKAKHPAGETNLIRSALARGQLTGGKKFIDKVERISGRRVEHRGPGRKAKTDE